VPSCIRYSLFSSEADRSDIEKQTVSIFLLMKELVVWEETSGEAWVVA